MKLLSEETSIVDKGTVELPPGPLGLRFESVSFTYQEEDESTPVLHQISLEIKPGRTLGVVGRTGGGKTTLARLALRLVEPTSGAVLLGGRRLSDVPLTELRARTGVISQDVHLVEASVYDNITLFDSTISPEAVRAALDALGLLGWVEAMPLGLDTPLGPGGGGLSAGEAQLLAMTRLFLRNPDFVLLDEASSRLDPATESRVILAIDRLIEGRSAIVIAHRLSTVERLDEILVLDSGRVVEHGPPQLLQADPKGHYAKLLAAGSADLISEAR